MAKQAIFYLIEKIQAEEALSAQEILACNIAAEAWRQGKKVLIACETEQQALQIDDALWAREADQFVPHNLSGEITAYATPVEISWSGKRNAQRRDLLISLQNNVPDFAQNFNQVIDFVPQNEAEKVIARERYKLYRQMGFEMVTEKV